MGDARHSRETLISPIPRLLRCNDPPTPDEVVQIRKQIKLVETEFEALAGLPYAKGLGKCNIPPQAHGHLLFLNQHRQIVVGHRFLPAEILEEIFYFTFHLDYIGRQHSFLRQLTHVCRRWRLTAISSPRLWTQLPRIEIRSRHTPRVESNRFQELKAYLHRARDRPISFTFVNNIKPKKEACGEETLNFLSYYCHRWAEVILSIDMKYVHILRRVRGMVPNLRSLELHVTRTGPPADDIFDPFEIAPSLRHVFIQHSDSDSGPIVSLPWPQLETYREQPNSESGLGNVINHSANISSIECMTDHLDILVLRPVTHRKLTRLHLRISSAPNASLSIFDGLCLPSLSDLLFHSRCGVVPLEGVLSLIARSACFLKALSLTGCVYGFETVTAILFLCPELERLAVDYLDRQNLLRLTFDPNNADILVPHLKELAIHHLYYPVGFPNERIDTILDGPAMTEMARSRTDIDEARQELPLKVSMTFFHEYVCDRQLAALEGLPSSLFVSPIMEAMIQRWNKVLSKELSYCHRRSPKLNSSYNRLPRQLNQTFEEMESYPIVDTDSTTLVRAGIPELLQEVASMSRYGSGHAMYPGPAICQFKERARDLCEKWKPSFILDARSRRWTYHGRLALEYVPANDARREGENAWKMAAGCSDPPLLRDYVWNS